MFGWQSRKARQARIREVEVENLQIEVDYIYLVALTSAIREHPEWTPLAAEMVGFFE